MRNSARNMALGGILAAVAVVIMCLGGLIPVATYVCPMFCCMLCNVILQLCGRRIAWAWYGTVALLGLLMGPDKEAAAVFLFLGVYPMVKPVLEKWPISWLWKLLFFNGAAILLYAILIWLIGMTALAGEFMALGWIGLGVILLLANVTFVLLDCLLGKYFLKDKRRKT